MGNKFRHSLEKCLGFNLISTRKLYYYIRTKSPNINCHCPYNLLIIFTFQIEREKADLSVQVIQMSERLEEAEGGAESQVNLLKNL